MASLEQTAPAGGAAAPGRDAKVIGLISAGHFFSHFYLLSLPPLFVFLQRDFEISYVALGLTMTG